MRRWCRLFSAAIRAASSTIGPREVFTRIAVFFILARSAAPDRPRVRADNTRWIDTKSDVFEQFILADVLGAARCSLFLA